MVVIQADFTKEAGKIKPMHAVNNGPVGNETDETGNFESYKTAKIPYARNHDASFYVSYSGEHIVDVQAIFPDFSKEVDDESAYDFKLTDLYLQNMLDCSRNAVMKPEQVKKFVGILRDFGYTMLQLCTEDTYEVEGEPFFRYLSGRYSVTEMQDIVMICTLIKNKVA